MKSWTIKLPASLSAKVSVIAKKRRMSRSALVREALEQMTSKGDEGTFIDRIKEHIGVDSELPADIASNKKHLKSYGR